MSAGPSVGQKRRCSNGYVGSATTRPAGSTAPQSGRQLVAWEELAQEPAEATAVARPVDCDMAAILYTSGSTGHPKGVVLSYRNLLVGAESVSQYLGNRPSDRILSVLPLSFDAGLSQILTAFRAGARCVLLNYLLPRLLSGRLRVRPTQDARASA